MTMSQINDVATQQAINGPDVYSTFVSTQTSKEYSGIKNLAGSVFPTSSLCTSVAVAGTRVFAKTAAWGADLWDECVSPYYESGARRMPPPQPQRRRALC